MDMIDRRTERERGGGPPLLKAAFFILALLIHTDASAESGLPQQCQEYIDKVCSREIVESDCVSWGKPVPCRIFDCLSPQTRFASCRTYLTYNGISESFKREHDMEFPGENFLRTVRPNPCMNIIDDSAAAACFIKFTNEQISDFVKTNHLEAYYTDPFPPAQSPPASKQRPPNGTARAVALAAAPTTPPVKPREPTTGPSPSPPPAKPAPSPPPQNSYFAPIFLIAVAISSIGAVFWILQPLAKYIRCFFKILYEILDFVSRMTLRLTVLISGAAALAFGVYLVSNLHAPDPNNITSFRFDLSEASVNEFATKAANWISTSVSWLEQNAYLIYLALWSLIIFMGVGIIALSVRLLLVGLRFGSSIRSDLHGQTRQVSADELKNHFRD
jgi:hypothetical protein